MTTERRTVRVTPGLVVGVAVMLLGAVLTLDNFGLFEGTQIIRFWPLLLVALGVARLVGAGQLGRHPDAYVFLFLGVGLLFVNFGVVRFRDMLAVLLLCGGAAIAWRAAKGAGRAPTPASLADPSRYFDLVAIMGGVHRLVGAQDFQGGHATAVLGGCEIDLTRASPAGGVAVINIFAFWGGVDIKVPDDWAVEIQGVAVLGGFTDSSHRPLEDRKKLIVTGYTVMGGVEVHN
jgi:Domain of unknown function (DUF5668)/Cell wall-active antibiotics response 4TMS YvqF